MIESFLSNVNAAGRRAAYQSVASESSRHGQAVFHRSWAQANIYEQPRKIQSRVNRNTALTVFLAIVLVLAIFGTVLIIVLPQPGEPFTELYLLGPAGKAADYPTNLTVGQTGNVTVGVVNHENTNANYTLVVRLDNATVATRSFSLANNEKWQDSIAFKPTHRGTGQKLDFNLYKGSDPNVYRSVYLYLNVT
jgi:uncharacterized membrane protein